MSVMRKSGDNVKLTSTGAESAGSPKMVGSGLLGGLFGVLANGATGAGEILSLLTRGEFDLPKPAGEGIAPAEGDRLYWDSVDEVVTTEAIGPVVAECTLSALDADTTVRARLTGTVTPLARHLVVGEFDASEGVAIGTHTWDGPTIPAGYRVIRGFYKVGTTFTSASDAATIALGFNTDDAAGIVAAVAISNGGNPWDAGFHEAIQTGTIANVGEKLTAARPVEILVAVEALTAGTMTIYLEIVPVS